VMPVVPAMVLLGGFTSLPHTPRWLMRSRRTQIAQENMGKADELGKAALDSLERYWPSCTDEELEAEIKNIEASLPPQRGHLLTDLLPHGREMLVTLGLVVLQPLTGQPAMLNFAVSVFRKADLSAWAGYLMAVVASLQLGASLLLTISENHRARSWRGGRLQVLIGVNIMAFSFIVLALSFMFAEDKKSVPGHFTYDFSFTSQLLATLASGGVAMGGAVSFGTVPFFTALRCWGPSLNDAVAAHSLLVYFVAVLGTNMLFLPVLDFTSSEGGFFGLAFIASLAIVIVLYVIPQTPEAMAVAQEALENPPPPRLTTASTESPPSPEGLDTDALLNAQLEFEAKTPHTAWLVLLGMCASAGLLGILQHSVVKCGSAGYWVIGFFKMIILFCCGAYGVMRITDKHKARIEAGFGFLKNDIRWDGADTLGGKKPEEAAGGPLHWIMSCTGCSMSTLLPILCVPSGLCAGLFGIGGGIIKGPLMLELDVHPEVAAATAAYMIAFTSGSATLVYALYGLIPVDYGIQVTLIGMLGSYLGSLATEKIVRKYKCSSVIVFAVSFIVLLSAGLMAWVSTETLKHGYHSHGWCSHAGQSMHSGER